MTSACATIDEAVERIALDYLDCVVGIQLASDAAAITRPQPVSGTGRT